MRVPGRARGRLYGLLWAGFPCRVQAVAVAIGMVGSGCAPAEEGPTCPEGEVQDVESASCVPEACGAESWGTLDRDDGTVHVAPWGEDGGDGSEPSPLRSIQAGADLAGEQGGGLVAVAAGTWGENLELGSDHDGVRLAGRCPALVTIAGDDPAMPAILVLGGEIELASLTIAGDFVGIWVEHQGFGEADLRVSEVSVEGSGTLGLGLAGAGAKMTLEACSVSGTRSADDGRFGRGLGVQQGATLQAHGLRLEANHETGLYVTGLGTLADVEDVVIRGTLPRPDGTLGRGIAVGEGATLVARRVTVQDNHAHGIFAAGAGTLVDVSEGAVLDTHSLPAGSFGRGIEVRDGAVLTAGDLAIERSADLGLLGGEPGTTVDLRDVTVRGTCASQWGGGTGISIQDGASLSAQGLAVEEVTDLGIGVSGDGSVASLRDVSVLRTCSLPDGSSGLGLGLMEGATVEAIGLLLEGNHEVGLMVTGAGSSATIEQGTVLGTLPAGGLYGRGISVESGGALVGRDLLLESNTEVGVYVGLTGTAAILEDVVVRDTQSLSSGTGGRGVSVEDGATLSAARLLVERNHEVGLLARGGGTMADLEDVEIVDTLPLPDGRRGRGLSASLGARVVARGLRVEGNRDIGVFAESEGTRLDVQDVVVSGTRSAPENAGGTGIVCQLGARIDGVGLDIEDCEGPGLHVAGGGAIDARDVALVANGFAGAVVLDAALSLRGGSVGGSLPHPSEGGGVGVFAWGESGAPWLEIMDVQFADLPGPAIYLRGDGHYVATSCGVREAGTWPWLPGGVLAIEGVGAWTDEGIGGGTGLLLEGNTFEDLPGDAILLDHSAALLDRDPETLAPNAFSDLGGLALVWQRCQDAAAPQILDDSVAAPTCTDQPRALGPLLDYRLWLAETDVIE